MELFSEGFPQADGTAADQTSESQQASAGPPEATHEVQPSASASNLSAPDGHEADLDTPLRGKAATEGMTVDEKKERQKQQNRLAAERSRSKKREEL